MYDGRIGRWLSVDPKGQFSSPYEGMGNNPVTGNDPTGAVATSPIFYEITGEFLGVDSQGYTGDILFADKSTYNALSNDNTKVIDHNLAEKDFLKPTMTNMDASIESLGANGISLQALSSAYTDILKQGNFNTQLLFNNAVSIDFNDYSNQLFQSYNDPQKDAYSFSDAQWDWEKSGKINVTAQWSSFNGTFYTTVENVEEGLGVHELTFHGIHKLTNDDHHYIFGQEISHSPFFNGITPDFKNYIYEEYQNTK